MDRPRLAALFSALALAACSCGGAEEAPPRPGVLPEPPDIVLVTIDTLRADHLGCYGYFRDTSPNLDALAAEGILFERAIATMGTTLPSHLSLMTGLYPHQHGFVANQGAMKARFSSRPGRRPLAELLRQAGYATAAFVSGPTVSSATGIEAGFDVFDDHRAQDPDDIFDTSRRADATNERVFEWLATAPDRPLFLWVHYWDPHEPNRPPEPYASMFPPDERLDALIDERRIDPETLRERFSDEELARLFAPELLRELRDGRPAEMPPIDRAAVRELLSLYDGDVRFADDQLGRLFARLRERGRWDATIVAVTSDHGQALGQHDWLEHGRIQLEDTHIPLVLRLPPGLLPQPARRPEVVSLIDVLPTVAARLDLPQVETFLEQAEGRDLLAGAFDRPYAFSQRALRNREWGPGDSGQGLQFAITVDEWRYYHRAGGADELYHLPTDPGELQNVLDEHPELAAKLERVVRQVVQDRPWQGGDELAEGAGGDWGAMLKTLGYLDDE